MAEIRPFRGIRPAEDKAKAVAALPYDVMNTEEAREAVIGNPYSFLHVDKAEIDLPSGINLYDHAVYEKASNNLQAMLKNGVMLQDHAPAFYIYQLTMEGRSQTGLVVCTSIDEYLNNIIKKHELTRADKEQDRINHVDICNANTGPIFLAYRRKKEIQDKIQDFMKNNQPVYNFTADDDVRHTVWVILDQALQNALIEQFKTVESLYIADGHHRNASAVKVGQKRRAEHPNYTGQEEFNYYLSVIFPGDELKILDYNRVVKDLNGYTKDAFLGALKKKFIVTPHEGPDALKPEKSHTFGLYLKGKWYLLEAKPECIVNDPVLSLDVSILQNEVLQPILGIDDPRTDKRIDFVGGIRGLSELEKRVDSDEMAAAFSMFPTSVEELMEIADAGKIMPPKSTWFEPKLRSGLFIHSLDD